jgi:hypothetical protein
MHGMGEDFGLPSGLDGSKIALYPSLPHRTSLQTTPVPSPYEGEG